MITGALLAFLLTLPAMVTERRVAVGDNEPAMIVSKETEVQTGYDASVVVRVKNGDETEEIALNDYLRGVVAAEMPASFPMEALKAQTVAARSFILWCAEISPKHEDADVCNDPSHCKAYLSDEEICASYGAKATETMQKLDDAIAETDGVVIFYEGQPIMAAFFAASSGKTESAADVWGGEIPYLVSVESPDAEEYIYKETEISFEDFKENFQGTHPEAVFGETVNGWFSGTERSSAGSILHITVGGVTVTGAEIRSMFDLPSANFTIMARGEKLIFTTLGHGHGVGMSQYGAKAMAEEGIGYEEILQTYYSGVAIEHRK